MLFRSVLAALADHGFTPTAIVTRLTYLSAPDSVQGALAAGLLGGGSRFLGVTEDSGRFLDDVLKGVDGELPTDDARFARNEGRTANRDELRPLLVDRLRTRSKQDWFADIIAAGVPCGPINTVDQGVAFAQEIGLDPVVTVGEGAAAIPSVQIGRAHV